MGQNSVFFQNPSVPSSLRHYDMSAACLASAGAVGVTVVVVVWTGFGGSYAGASMLESSAAESR